MGWAVLEGNEDDLLLDKTVHNAQTRSIGIGGAQEIHDGPSVIAIQNTLILLDFQEVFIKVET